MTTTTTTTTTTLGQRIAATMAGPLLAAGILMGSMVVGDTAAASAQPSAGTCTSMPMADGQDGTAPNALTRAGQVSAAAGPGASDGSMPANCAPAGHG